MTAFKMEVLHGYMISRTAFTIKNCVHKLFKSKGYTATPEHWAILNLLEQEEGLSQSELAEKTIKDKANITRILDVMQRNGLIQRRKHEKDRRAYKIFLTEKGRKRHDTLTQFVHEVDTQAGFGLSKEELKELKRILIKICANFDK